jgi:two-component system, response regulator PdtaR
MSLSLRVVVADDEVRMRDFYAAFLPVLGHQVVGSAGSGRELIERCVAQRPDLVITDVKMPELDGIAAVAEVFRNKAVPVIIVTAYDDCGLLERAQAGPALAYLIKPIKQADLAPAIAIARRRFAEFEALHRESAELRQALQDRKVIERAKGVLMLKTGLNEPDAFYRLQQLARDKNRKLVDIALSILTAEEACQPAKD